MTQKEKEEAEAMFCYLIGDEETSRDEIINRFSRNSQHYERVMAAMNNNCARMTAQTTAELFPSNRNDVYILDVAAGTGLCAEQLYSHGFRKMDALEPSKQMLDEARKKDLYGRYIVDVLGENTLQIGNDTYDAVTISGMSTMVLKKLPVNAMEQLIRIVKRGKCMTAIISLVVMVRIRIGLLEPCYV
ncbi:methyltransferase-like protein 27 [Haliotis asinina]|uniref:methyltransferase-like protein 27 n=1 Tax=Haliotis asinina TaxID=109174 RepID=UPI0035321475